METNTRVSHANPEQTKSKKRQLQKLATGSKIYSHNMSNKHVLTNKYLSESSNKK